MQFKTLALATTSLVALGLAVAPATAASKMMGDLTLGYGQNWDDFSDGGESSEDFDIQYPGIIGTGHVNLPYTERVNIQLDAVSRASLDESFFNGKNNSPSQTMYFGLGGHINYRDETGLLGVFSAVGRTNDTFNEAAPFWMAGFEGQYFCNEWTFSAQVGYMDADESYLMKNAGFVRAGAAYYPSKKLKIRGELAYMAGEQDTSNFSTNYSDVESWAWVLGVDYWFGQSMPVSGFAEYRGRSSEVDFVWTDYGYDVDVNVVNIGVKFHFGGADFMDTDRNGASADLPDIDWYRLDDGEFGIN